MRRKWLKAHGCRTVVITVVVDNPKVIAVEGAIEVGRHHTANLHDLIRREATACLQQGHGIGHVGGVIARIIVNFLS